MLEERTDNPAQAKLLRYVEILNDTHVRRCVGSDQALVVTRDVRGEVVVALVREHEMSSYRKLGVALLEREMRVIGHEQYRAVKARAFHGT